MSLATEFRVEMRMPINPTAKEYADVTEGSLSRTAEAARAQHRLHRIGQQDAVWVDPKAANRTAGFATATLVLGIVSFFFSPVAIVAFITAHFATRNGQRTAGRVCSWITVVCTVVLVAVLVFAYNALSSVQ